tara:strand:+ start:59 stop:850 length:792 start_codon:yes stop_codon:yes gene_type:complete
MSTFYTLTYSDGFQGWPSFYSFEPDWMIGMNNYFYTFKSGDIYRHNVNQIRNNFYNTQHTSTITSVFNDQPLENKLFKTINLESSFADGTHAWGGTFDTDIQTTGFINAEYFELKEGAWFAFMRNEGNVPTLATDLALRSVNGIGQCSSVTTVGADIRINFSNTTSIGSSVSIGDTLYATTALTLIGTVTDIVVDIPTTGSNYIQVNTPAATPNPNDLILFIKNQVAESYGVLGHYCEFVLTNTSTSAVELFAVESEVMKSFP